METEFWLNLSSKDLVKAKDFFTKIGFTMNERHQAPIFLAIGSGAVTSGMGYVLWSLVLKKMKTNNAALVQLSVPVLAAFGGILFLGETFKLRLAVSSLFIFGGIFLKIKKFNSSRNLP